MLESRVFVWSMVVDGVHPAGLRAKDAVIVECFYMLHIFWILLSCVSHTSHPTFLAELKKQQEMAHNFSLASRVKLNNGKTMPTM